MSKQATGGVVTNEQFGVFLDGLPPSATPSAPPYIGIDECVNPNPKITQAAKRWSIDA